MKKFLTIAIAAAFIFAGQASNAQDFRFGVKGGVNFSTIHVKDVNAAGFKVEGDNSRRVGYDFGVVANYTFPSNKRMGIQAELTYSSEGTKMKVGDESISNICTTGSAMLNSFLSSNETTSPYGITVNLASNDAKIKATAKFGEFKLPIMFTYNVIDKLSVMAGPYISYRVSSKAKLNLDDVCNKLTASAAVGGATLLSGTPKELLATKVPELLQQIHTLYPSIPALTSAELIAVINGAAGVNVLNSDASINNGELEDKAGDYFDDYVKKFDFGVAVGAEYGITDNIAVNVRWDIACMNCMKKIEYTDVTTGADKTIKIKGHGNSLKLGVIYRF